ncbi:MAG: hypothetical protein MRK01_14555 [Candidatus Scalindua sp.]|nr:hypothetical protein [Candidatus Scalindua sp.]
MIQKLKAFLSISITCGLFPTAGVRSILIYASHNGFRIKSGKKLSEYNCNQIGFSISPYRNIISGTIRDLHLILNPVMGIFIWKYVFFCCEIFGHMQRIFKENFFHISQRINNKGNPGEELPCAQVWLYKNGVLEGLRHRHDSITRGAVEFFHDNRLPVNNRLQ